MFNTNISSRTAHEYGEQGYDEFEAEIERQLAALGPISEDELNDELEGNESDNEFKLAHEKSLLNLHNDVDDSPSNSWQAFLEASQSRDKQIESWKQELNEGLEDLVTVRPTRSVAVVSIPITTANESPPSSPPQQQQQQQQLLSTAIVPSAPLSLEHILKDLKELQQFELQQQKQQNNTNQPEAQQQTIQGHQTDEPHVGPPLPPSALDRERMQIEREIEDRERMKREEEERIKREKEVEERRREIERKREEEEARIAEEGRKLREKMEEVKRARDEMLRIEKEREQERIRAQKEREEERKRRQEEERLREEEEEKERRRIADAERKARIERETRLREEARKRKEEEEKRAALKALQEQKAKEEQEALRKEQERRRVEDEKKRVASIEAKKREIALLKKATKRDGRASPSQSPSSSPAVTPSTPTKPRPSSSEGSRSRHGRRSQPLPHAQSLVHPRQAKVEKEGSLVHVSSSPASLVGPNVMVESPLTSASQSQQLAKTILNHAASPPSDEPLVSSAIPTQTKKEPDSSQSLARPSSALSDSSAPTLTPQASTVVSTSETNLAIIDPTHTTESKSAKATHDTWLEDNMRASNARLYQSSVVVPTRAHGYHNKPTTEVTVDAARQHNSERADKESNHIDPHSNELQDINLSRPTTGTTPHKAEIPIPKGVSLSKELINSNYPAISPYAITHLDLSLESINKIEDLQHYPNLQSLYLNTNYINNMEGLAPCTNLGELELKNNPLCAPLNFPFLPSLSFLSLDVCRLAHLSSSLPTSLLKISINGNQFTSLEELHSCDKLQYIAARRNQLQSLPTFLMPHLLKLDLASNKLRTLVGFTSWAPLVGSINASHNRLSAWPADMRAPLLRELHLNGNLIDSFGPVGFLPLLRHLDLSDNRITHVDWVGGCPLLDTLLLSRNAIAAFSAIRPLATLRELRVLKLDGNPVASSMLYPNSLGDICPRLEEVDGQPFTINTVRPSRYDALSPNYVKYWIAGSGQTIPQPYEQDNPAWWDFNSVLQICLKLSLQASDAATRHESQPKNQVYADELTMARSHFAVVQALALHPETFILEFLHLVKAEKASPEQHAATTIQALWRGHASRSRLGITLKYRVQHVRAAILIQKIWRGYVTRVKSPYSKLKMRKWAASVLIQKIWRGHMVRKTLKQARQAIREAFADYGWDLGPAPSFELPVLEELELELELEPPDEFFEDLFDPPNSNFTLFQQPQHSVTNHYHRQVEPTIVYVKEKPPTPVQRTSSTGTVHHSTEMKNATPKTLTPASTQSQSQYQYQYQYQYQSQYQSQPQQIQSQSQSQSQYQPKPQSPLQPHPQSHLPVQPEPPSSLTGDAHMDAVAHEWNFKDPKTLETLMKRERKRNMPNRSHQQLPARRSSNGYRYPQEKQVPSLRTTSSPSLQHEDASKNVFQSQPRRGRQIAAVSVNSLFITPNPPSAPGSFLPGLKPPPHPNSHHSTSKGSTGSASSASSTSGGGAFKKLPPIVRPKEK